MAEKHVRQQNEANAASDTLALTDNVALMDLSRKKVYEAHAARLAWLQSYEARLSWRIRRLQQRRRRNESTFAGSGRVLPLHADAPFHTCV